MSTTKAVSEIEPGNHIKFSDNFGKWARANVTVKAVEPESNLGRTFLAWRAEGGATGTGYFDATDEFAGWS